MSNLTRRPLRIGFAIVAMLGIGLPSLDGIQVLDLKLLDAQFSLLRERAAAPIDADVVLVGIDDRTTALLPEPIALWHPHLGKFFRAMAVAEPAVVGLDINLPDRSYEFLVPGSDKAVLAGLLQMRKVAPVVLGLTVNASGEVRPIFPPFVSMAGEDAVGYVLWKLESDRIVRRFDERLGEGGERVSTLAGAMARHIGVEPGSGFINYAVGETFDYVPLHDVLAWFDQRDTARLQATFAGRPVLLGSVLPFVDRHYQSVDLAGWEENGRFAPGMLLHAQALRSVLGPGFVQPVPHWVLILAGLLAAGLWWFGTTARRAVISLAVAAVLLPVLSTWLLGGGLHLGFAGAGLTCALAVLGRIGFEMAGQILERRRLRRAFAGVVSPEVLKQILAGSLPEIIKVNVCVLFSDIRGFTTRSEGMPPEEVVSFLNRYFDEMTAPIHDNGGTLDKFMGDGIMAFFGAPNSMDNPSQQAFEAARGMIERLEAFNLALSKEGTEAVRIGVGLHRGDVVVGQVGSRDRREYTAVGDVVNAASRIEGLTKEHGFPVICSADVVATLEQADEFVDLGKIPIRGRAPLELRGWPGGG